MPLSCSVTSYLVQARETISLSPKNFKIRVKVGHAWLWERGQLFTWYKLVCNVIFNYSEKCISSFNLNELKYNKRETCHPCNLQVMSSFAAGALGGLLAKSKLGFSEIEKQAKVTDVCNQNGWHHGETKTPSWRWESFMFVCMFFLGGKKFADTRTGRIWNGMFWFFHGRGSIEKSVKENPIVCGPLNRAPGWNNCDVVHPILRAKW